MKKTLKVGRVTCFDKKLKWKHSRCSLDVPGSIPGLGKGTFVVQTCFPSCHCRLDMKTVQFLLCPLDQDVNWRPPV